MILEKRVASVLKPHPFLLESAFLQWKVKKGDNILGFTLIELLSTLILLGVLLTLAVSSGQHLLAKNRTIAQVDGLMGGLYYARSQAIFRNEKLIFCKSTDQKKCGGQWRDGQILIDSAGNVLRTFAPIFKKNNLIWNSSGGVDDFVTWLPTGYTQGQRGTFYYCVGEGNVFDSRNIVLSDAGRLYVSSMTVMDYFKWCQ